MKAHRGFLSVLAACLMALAACGQKDAAALSDDQAIDIAAHHLIGKAFSPVPPATVSHGDGKYTVVFTRPTPGGSPGENYQTRVVFDEKTHEALEIEVVSADNAQTQTQAVAPIPSPAPATSGANDRSTPLNEEVDAIEALQKQLGGR